MTYQHQKLLPRHFRLVELFLQGLDHKHIAQMLGMTPQGVMLVYNSPLVQDELARRRVHQQATIDEGTAVDLSKVRQKFELAAEQAADVQIDLLGAEKDDIRLKASNSILDRVLGSADPTVKQVTNISIESLQVLIQAMKESRRVEPELEAVSTNA